MVSLFEYSPSSTRWRAGVRFPDEVVVFPKLFSGVMRLGLQLLDEELREAHEVKRRRDSGDDLKELEEEEEEDVKLGWWANLGARRYVFESVERRSQDGMWQFA